MRYSRRLAAVALGVVLAACGDDSSSAQDEAGRPDESSSSSSESQNDAETETDTGEASSESESGMDDLAPPDGPDFESPAHAEDLDPDPDKVRVELTAAPFEYELVGALGSETIAGFAYNEQVPGPTIRAKLGDEVTVVLRNELGFGTTIHWHGLHVPFEMDGVTWMGEPVADGATFEYTFTVDQTGTYWYHPHFDTVRQVDLGLYGAFVIEDPADPPVDEEIVMVLDGWHESEAPISDHEGTLLDWTVNGLIDPIYRPLAGTSVRMRIIDVANAGYVDLQWPKMRRIGGDQGVLAALDEPESVVLAPGDRMDGELLVGADTLEILNLPYSLFGPVGSEPVRLMSVQPDGDEAAPDPANWDFDELAPTLDPGFADVLYVFMGDTDAGAWTINGETFPDVTIESLPLGQEAIIEVRNISASEHPFHLHGYGFEVLSVNGVPPEFRQMEDTINIHIADTIRVRISATNPGDWMTHCHILPHADQGMMTVLRVE